MKEKKKGCFKIEGWRWELKDLLGLREATCLNDKPKASGVKLFFSIEEWLWGKENKQRKHGEIYLCTCVYVCNRKEYRCGNSSKSYRCVVKYMDRKGRVWSTNIGIYLCEKCFWETNASNCVWAEHCYL